MSAYIRQVKQTLQDPVFIVFVSCIMLVHLGSMTPIVHLVQRGLDIGKRRAPSRDVGMAEWLQNSQTYGNLNSDDSTRAIAEMFILRAV